MYSSQCQRVTMNEGRFHLDLNNTMLTVITMRYDLDYQYESEFICMDDKNNKDNKDVTLK